MGRREWVVGRGDWGLGSGGMWSGEWGGCRVGKWEWGVGEGGEGQSVFIVHCKTVEREIITI